MKNNKVFVFNESNFKESLSAFNNKNILLIIDSNFSLSKINSNEYDIFWKNNNFLYFNFKKFEESLSKCEQESKEIKFDKERWFSIFNEHASKNYDNNNEGKSKTQELDKILQRNTESFLYIISDQLYNCFYVLAFKIIKFLNEKIDRENQWKFSGEKDFKDSSIDHFDYFKFFCNKIDNILSNKIKSSPLSKNFQTAREKYEKKPLNLVCDLFAIYITVGLQKDLIGVYEKNKLNNLVSLLLTNDNALIEIAKELCAENFKINFTNIKSNKEYVGKYRDIFFLENYQGKI